MVVRNINKGKAKKYTEISGVLVVYYYMHYQHIVYINPESKLLLVFELSWINFLQLREQGPVDNQTNRNAAFEVNN